MHAPNFHVIQTLALARRSTTKLSMPQLDRRDLINYAFVSQGIFGANDLLSALLPLIQPIVAELEGQVFDPEVLTQKISSRFPWKISSDAIELLPPRMEHLDWVKKILDKDGRAAYIFKSIPYVPFDDAEANRIDARLSEIGGAFRELLKEISPLESAAYENADLEELLLRWLVEAGGFDRGSILAAARSSMDSRGDIDESKLSEELKLGRARAFRNQDDYLCGRFIQYLAENDKEKFEDIVALSALTLIAEVILNFREPKGKTTKTNVDFYYDGPFVMDLLGLTGAARQKNAQYIHDSVGELSANIRILDHSCDEIRDNLNAMFSLPRPRRHGPTWDAICKAQIQEQFANEVRQNVDVYVQNLDIPTLLSG